MATDMTDHQPVSAASIFSGRLIHQLGVGGLLAAAAATTALSLLDFALLPTWWLLLPAALLLGAGGGCIDGGLNNYAAATTSPRVLTWLHAFYGVGATAGPLLMTAILAGGHAWQLGVQMRSKRPLCSSAFVAVTIKRRSLQTTYAWSRG